MVTTYVIAGIIAVLIILLCIWVTSKAYSRKWDE
ncbi:hypothetical protein J2Z45_000470 [Cohnella lubricantis]|nr:hypothetical protein [Cohnella lubricantis]